MRYETTTRAIPPSVLQLAREFFGGRFGLTETASGERSVSFEGGGGGVAIEARGASAGTVVEIVTREWDIQVREFIGLLASQR
ncbi:MAG: hypothetical protein U0556_02030 [Dehalococcoidia bacterium]